MQILSRSLRRHERGAYAHHLLRLAAEDRRLRFGVALDDDAARLRFVPSATALGLACVIPASISLAMFAGALAAWAFAARVPGLAARFTIAAAAGLVAGESLVGVAAALSDMARG